MTDWFKILSNYNYKYYSDEVLKKSYVKISKINEVLLDITILMLFASPWIVHFFGFFWQILLTLILLCIFVFLFVCCKSMFEDEIIKRREISLLGEGEN